MAFPATPLDVLVEMAIGGDPSADPSTWSWTDITAYVFTRDGIQIGRGRNDRFGSAAPSTLALTVDNTGGRFVVRNPSGAYFGSLRRNVPIRVSVNGVPRFTGFVDSLPVSWDVSGKDPNVKLKAFGALKRLSRPAATITSTPRAYIMTTGPLAYWPMEDGELVSEGQPAVGTGTIAPWTGTHPSGAVITRAKWGTGSLGPWLPPAFGFGSSAGYTVLVGRVNGMQASPSVWTTSFIYAGSTGTGFVTLDINPGYLYGTTGWTQVTLDSPIRFVAVAVNGEPEVSAEFPELFDGLAHHVRLTLIQAGANVSWTLWIDGIVALSGTTAGAMTMPQLKSLGLVSHPDGGGVVGHLAVWTNAPSALAEAAAALGYPSEPAGRRIERLCDEQGVPLAIVDEYRTLDTFNRTVANNLGTADTGEVWELSGGAAADFDVAAGEATITQGTTTVVRAGIIGAVVGAFDARVLIEAPALSTGGAVGIHAGIVFRWLSDTDHYRAQLCFQPTGGMDFGLARAGGAGVSLATVVNLSGSYTAGTRVWVRVRGSGALFFGKAWRETEAEPSTWLVARDDDELTLGRVGFFARRGVGDTTVGPTYTFSQFSADSVLDDTQPMGPQPFQAFLPCVAEAESIDDGVWAEATTGEVEYLPGVSRYNRAVDLALDYDSGHIAPPFEPADDDAGIRNDVTASRPGGGSYPYTDPDHIAAEGRYDDAPTFNAQADAQLPDLASWQVHLGTVPELRYPQLTLRLHGNPALISDWLACRLSSRVTVDNPPPELPPDLIDQHILGYNETFDSFSWEVSANLAPASPYTVGIWEDTVLGRVDTDGARLASAINSSVTSISVETTAGDVWIRTATHAAEFPFDVRVGGEVMRVTAIVNAASPQTFTVTRGINGIATSHADEAAVSLAHPMVVAL